MIEHHADPLTTGDHGDYTVKIYKPNGSGVFSLQTGAPLNTKPAFPLIAFADIKLDTEVRNYLVKGLLPLSGVVVVWGPPKSGKSFWIMDIVLSAALGWEYRGRKTQQADVVYVALEGREGIPRMAGSCAAASRSRTHIVQRVRLTKPLRSYAKQSSVPWKPLEVKRAALAICADWQSKTHQHLPRC
jgi:hypothetical protein